MLTFNHFNFNVSDLDASLRFYREALGLEPMRRKEAEDGSFILVFLGDGKTDFRLELTWLRDWDRPYNLGDNEIHLAFTVDDFEAAHARQTLIYNKTKTQERPPETGTAVLAV